MTGNKKYAQYFMLINKNEKKNLNKKKIIYITVLTNGNCIFGTGIGTLF